MSAPKNRAPVLANAQLLELAPGDVMIPERIGFLHEDKAAALARVDEALADKLTRACFDSRDYQEGQDAFMNKRKPVFEGR